MRAHWGVRPARAASDLGGSANLNLLVTDGGSLRVARVYRPFVTGQRVAALQAVRRHLARHGIPCPEPIPSLGGRRWETFQGRAVEVEPYLAAPAVMNTLARVRTGLPVLGRIHALLHAFPPDPAAAAPRFANYVAADGLVEAVAAGTRRIRGWRPSPAEARLADLADLADQLAATLAAREQHDPVPLRRQLVHGDFWDTNVRFRHRQVALVTDFDFLGERPRTDDLALTLYFTSVDITDITRPPAWLRWPMRSSRARLTSLAWVQMTACGPPAITVKRALLSNAGSRLPVAGNAGLWGFVQAWAAWPSTC